MNAPAVWPELDLPVKPPFEPMLAKLVRELPTGEGWQFEPKWDGFRALCFRDGETLAIQSRAGQPLGRYFPEMVESLLALAPIDLGAVVHEAVKEIRRSAEIKRQTLSVTLDCDLPVVGDEFKLCHAILNLLDNEVKHDQGRVRWAVVEDAAEGGNLLGEDPTQQLERAEETQRRLEIIGAVAEAFTAEERAVLDLMLADERRTAVYAEKLGITPGTVRTWARHGLLCAHPYTDRGQCLYEPPGEHSPRKMQGHKLADRRVLS